MNHKIKNRILPLIFGLLFVVGTVTLIVRAATPVDLYFAPSSRYAENGSSFPVALRATTRGNAVDYVRAYINFPSDKLSVASISADGSSFDYQLEATVSAGQIRIARYSTTGVKDGDLLIATITFTAISTGTAVVGFDAGSGAYYTGGGSSQPTTATSPGSYTLTASTQPPPVVSPPTLPGSKPPSSKLPTPSVPPKTPPVVQPQPQTVTPDSPPTALPFAPATGSDGLVTYYPVSIIVKDHKNSPVAGVEVRSGDISLLTNDAGSASFALLAGEQTIYVTSEKVSKQFNVKVEPRTGDTGYPIPVQEFTLTLPDSGRSLLAWMEICLGLVTVVVILGLLFLRVRKHRRRVRHHRAIAASTVGVSSQHHQPVDRASTTPTTKPKKHKAKIKNLPLHPHDTTKTVQPLADPGIAAIVEQSPPAISVASGAQPPAELPVPVSSKSEMPKAVFTSLSPKPETRTMPPVAVDPYKPDGEPKDIFEMAEERYKNDDRLKDLR